MIDVLKLRKGAEITLTTGEKLIVHGAYMSTEGVVVTAKDNPAQVCARHVVLDKIAEVNEVK